MRVSLNLEGLIWIAAFLFLTIIIFSLIVKKSALAFIYDINISSNGLDFVLFSVWRVYALPFSDIEFVQEMKYGGFSALRAYNFKNRFFHRTFLIKKKKGFFARQVLVTPVDDVMFLRALANAGVKVKH